MIAPLARFLPEYELREAQAKEFSAREFGGATPHQIAAFARAAGLTPEDAGWREVRVRGSHHQFKKDGVSHLITISHPVKDVTPGQLRDVLKKSGIII